MNDERPRRLREDDASGGSGDDRPWEAAETIMREEPSGETAAGDQRSTSTDVSPR